MLQFYDDLPDDRWAAFLYVERQVRQHHLSGPPPIERRRRYVQVILVAAYELKLRILPEWQSTSGLLYRVAGLGLDVEEEGNGGCAQFERDLAAVMPKIESLAKRGTALRSLEQGLLILAEKQIRFSFFDCSKSWRTSKRHGTPNASCTLSEDACDYRCRRRQRTEKRGRAE